MRRVQYGYFRTGIHLFGSWIKKKTDELGREAILDTKVYEASLKAYLEFGGNGIDYIRPEYVIDSSPIIRGERIK